MRNKAFWFFSSTILFLLSRPLSAGTVINWTGNAGNDAYSNVLNWSPLNVPNISTESAQFNLDDIFNVTFSSGTTTTANDLLVDDGTVTLAANAAVLATYTLADDVLIDGGNLTLSQTGGNSDIVLQVNDILRVRDGSTFSVLTGGDVTVEIPLVRG